MAEEKKQSTSIMAEIDENNMVNIVFTGNHIQLLGLLELAKDSVISKAKADNLARQIKDGKE